jgi:hypothetical protein
MTAARTFELTPEGGGSKVAWSMEGPLAFIPRVMSLFISMDKTIGKDFEAGLADLKTVAERGSRINRQQPLQAG